MKNVLVFTGTGMEKANPLLWEERWAECSAAKIKDTLINQECCNQLKWCPGHKVKGCACLQVHLSDEPVVSEQVKLWCHETVLWSESVSFPAGIHNPTQCSNCRRGSKYAHTHTHTNKNKANSSEIAQSFRLCAIWEPIAYCLRTIWPLRGFQCEQQIFRFQKQWIFEPSHSFSCVAHCLDVRRTTIWLVSINIYIHKQMQIISKS